MNKPKTKALPMTKKDRETLWEIANHFAEANGNPSWIDVLRKAGTPTAADLRGIAEQLTRDHKGPSNTWEDAAQRALEDLKDVAPDALGGMPTISSVKTLAANASRGTRKR